MISKLKNVNIIVIDAEKNKQIKKNNLNEAFIDFVNKINDSLSKNVIVHNLCVIIGIDRLINNIDNGEEMLEELLKNTELVQNCSFIIVDNATKLKNHEYDSWYKEYISTDNGIWIGNGIDSQYLINISADRNEIVNNCGSSFGYAVKRENPNLIKLLEMKEIGDEFE